MILTVTLNPAVDYTVTVDSPVEPDGVLRSSTEQYDPGGKGINVSKYLAELGVETLATGLVGGFLGRYIEDQLTRCKVPNDFVEMDVCTRLNTTILAPDAEYKLNQSGQGVKAETVRELVGKIREYDPQIVVVAGSLPPNLGPAAVDRIANAGSWETVVDVQGDLLTGVAAEYALCKPNRDELASATGMPVHTVEECAQAAAALHERGFDRVIASLDDDGALLASDDGVFHAESLDVDVVDTVGAGDGLLAGVLSTLARGQTDRIAIRVGVTVASRVVGVPGTTIPDMANVRTEATEIPLHVG
ncbi:1-phosphofructokinase [Haladaptatus salinisoli]|uniref:1-phosphofructokinase n=1 Tax=Haladaptatus salinisoli TaxID=2884876 RepID=UPI001D0BE17F|nr:1-phosphofructokinase [Haladaptatus salinisoli]